MSAHRHISQPQPAQNHTESVAEEWRGVVGWEDLYQVSDQGRVRSLDRVTVDSLGRTQRFKGRVLKPRLDSDGRPNVVLCRDGEQTARTVHSLVALAFVGPRAEGMEVAHGDGDKLNNAASNLRYATPASNCADKLEHDTHDRGSRNGRAKLTTASAYRIKFKEAGSQREIAAKYGISKVQVARIRSGGNYGWLTRSGGPTQHPVTGGNSSGINYGLSIDEQPSCNDRTISKALAALEAMAHLAVGNITMNEYLKISAKLHWDAGAAIMTAAVEDVDRRRADEANVAAIAAKKLSVAQVIELKKALRDGSSQRGLAKSSGVSYGIVQSIARNETWSWVNVDGGPDQVRPSQRGKLAS